MSVNTLDRIYTEDKTALQKDRYSKAAAEFEKLFKTAPERFFSAPGRTEV